MLDGGHNRHGWRPREQPQERGVTERPDLVRAELFRIPQVGVGVSVELQRRPVGEQRRDPQQRAGSEQHHEQPVPRPQPAGGAPVPQEPEVPQISQAPEAPHSPRGRRSRRKQAHPDGWSRGGRSDGWNRDGRAEEVRGERSQVRGGRSELRGGRTEVCRCRHRPGRGHAVGRAATHSSDCPNGTFVQRSMNRVVGTTIRS